jgi:hypothetical protein
MPGQEASEIVSKLEQIDRRIGELRDLLLDQRTVKDFYTTHEIAKVVGKAEFTVREWCRLGRVVASKRACGRGKFQEWIVSHEELTRLRNEGLLPARKG